MLLNSASRFQKPGHSIQHEKAPSIVASPVHQKRSGSREPVDLVRCRRTGLVPAVSFPTALTLLRRGELILEWTNSMLDGDSGKQWRPADTKKFHRSSLVVVDGGRRQVEDGSDFDSRATEAGKANYLAQTRRERGNGKLHGRRHFKSVATMFGSHLLSATWPNLLLLAVVRPAARPRDPPSA